MDSPPIEICPAGSRLKRAATMPRANRPRRSHARQGDPFGSSVEVRASRAGVVEAMPLRGSWLAVRDRDPTERAAHDANDYPSLSLEALQRGLQHRLTDTHHAHGGLWLRGVPRRLAVLRDRADVDDESHEPHDSPSPLPVLPPLLRQILAM